MSDLTLRPATLDDDLATLAALDSKPALQGETLVAVVGSRPVAAIELATGTIVADPFEHTTDIVELLRMRARGAPAHRRRPAGRLLPKAA